MTVGVIERAFELARSGEYRSLEELKRRLSREGYESVASHLAGRLTKGQLTAMMTAAAGEASAPRQATARRTG